MFGNRIKLDDELFDKVKQCAEKAGYATVNEFVSHVLEKEVTRLQGPDHSSDPEDKVKKRLQGLGYIE